MPLLPRPQETQFFQNEAGKLYYQPAGYVRLAWGPDRLALATIEEFYTHVLSLLKSTGVRRILSDHGQRAPIVPAAQAWITGTFIPEAMSQARTHHCAVVEGVNPIHRLSTQSIISSASPDFHFKRFEAFEEADVWLCGLVLPA